MDRTLLPLPSVLRGRRVLVRPYRRGDGAALWARVDPERERLSAWLPWPSRHTCPEDSEAYARSAHARWLLRNDLTVALCTLDDELVGGSGLHRIDWDLRTFEIGYWIAEDWEGRGYVAEAVTLLAALAFERLDARRVEIRCEPGNTRSSAVPRRLGFVHEGTLRSVIRPPSGVVGDVMFWGLTRDDYMGAAWRDDVAPVVDASDTDG